MHNWIYGWLYPVIFIAGSTAAALGALPVGLLLWPHSPGLAVMTVVSLLMSSASFFRAAMNCRLGGR